MLKPVLASLTLSAVLTATLAAPLGAAGLVQDLSCDDRARMAQRLQVLGASRQGVGLRDPETMLEVWVEGQSGDWMIVQNYANGTSCIVAMGAYWQPDALEPA